MKREQNSFNSFLIFISIISCFQSEIPERLITIKYTIIRHCEAKRFSSVSMISSEHQNVFADDDYLDTYEWSGTEDMKIVHVRT